MNTNSPYPQFAPNPTAPLDLTGNSYLSDCTNVYESQTQGGGGGDYYTTGQEACYECNQTVNSLNPVNKGYQYMGTCSSARTVGETGAGYVSDCKNYYSANPANQGDFQDPASACGSCVNVGSSILNSDNGFFQSGTCSSLKPLNIENFDVDSLNPKDTVEDTVDSLNPIEQLKKKLTGIAVSIAVLVVVLIILYIVITHFM
jgi:hypothetical protein